MGCSKTIYIICTRDPNSELVLWTFFFVNNKKAEIFRCGRTEGCQHRWHHKVLAWASLKLHAEPLSLVYCNVRYMHGRARCLGWWLLRNRRFKRKRKKKNKKRAFGHQKSDISSSTRGKVWIRKTARIFSSQRGSTAWKHLKISKKSRRTFTRHRLRIRHPVCKGTSYASYC